MFEDYDNVKFLIAFSDPNQPYSCREWGDMPDGGSSQIIHDQGSLIWGLFQSGGAFPSSALLNHEMMVYDKNPSPFADAILTIQYILGNDTLTDCIPDVNQDGIVNVSDVIILVDFILN